MGIIFVGERWLVWLGEHTVGVFTTSDTVITK